MELIHYWITYVFMYDSDESRWGTVVSYVEHLIENLICYIKWLQNMFEHMTSKRLVRITGKPLNNDY